MLGYFPQDRWGAGSHDQRNHHDNHAGMEVALQYRDQPMQNTQMEQQDEQAGAAQVAKKFCRDGDFRQQHARAQHEVNAAQRLQRCQHGRVVVPQVEVDGVVKAKLEERHRQQCDRRPHPVDLKILDIAR